MHDRTVERIGQERATRAPLFPFRTKHEVINDELAPSPEEIGDRLPAARPIENVVLLNPLPRQRAPLPAEFIAQPREFLFLTQEFFAGGQPFSRRHHRRRQFRFARHCCSVQCRDVQRSHVHFSYPSSFFDLSFSLFFERTTLATTAAIPPVDITLPTTSAALAIQAGHIESSFLRRKSLMAVD